MIIRSKFPQRYKLHGTEYVYQDLEFVKDGIPDEEKRYVNSIPEFTVPPRHRKPKKTLIARESHIESKQHIYNNSSTPIKKEVLVKIPVSPVKMNMHLDNMTNDKYQPYKSDITIQNQFKSNFTNHDINYKVIPYVSVIEMPKVSTSNSLPNADTHINYPSNFEECALDLTIKKPVKQSSNIIKSYKSHKFTNNYDILSDNEEPDLIIDEHYESKNEYNREETSINNIPEAKSSKSTDMDVEDYIKQCINNYII